MRGRCSQEERSAWSQHAVDFSNHACRILCIAEHARAEGQVKGCIFERKVFSLCQYAYEIGDLWIDCNVQASAILNQRPVRLDTTAHVQNP